MSKRTYVYLFNIYKRPIKETCKRDLWQRHKREINMACMRKKKLRYYTYVKKYLHSKSTYIHLFYRSDRRDLSKRPLKKTYKRDSLKRPKNKRDLKGPHEFLPYLSLFLSHISAGCQSTPRSSPALCS